MLIHMMRVFQCKDKRVQTTILAMEILLLPPGLISTLLMLRRAAGHLSSLHVLFSGLVRWEHWVRRSSPPLFLCVFVNSIVILILLTSSKLHRRKSESLDIFSYDPDDPAVTVDRLTSVPLFQPPPAAVTVTLEDEGKEKLEERRDTIDATWAAIGGGDRDDKEGSKLKKSETWPKPPQSADEQIKVDALSRSSVAAATPPSRKKELRKSMTFNDSVLVSRRGGLARDDRAPHCPDELNKRFEDFIRNFNHELRLQRQDSEERFWERIKRGL